MASKYQEPNSSNS